MASVERVKGRLTRLYQAMQKSDLTKDRVSEYESSMNYYTAMLIAQVGAEEADQFIKGLSQSAAVSEG